MSAKPEEMMHLMTVEEFFAWPGDGTSTKYQLINGEPVAMAPASTSHSMIQGNTIGLLRDHFRRGGVRCAAMPEGAVSPRLDSKHNVRVPDVTVVCRPTTRKELVAPEPVLVVEVLSPSNEKETEANIYSYASIPSVREILVLRSDRMQADVATRNAAGEWPVAMTTYLPGAAVVLESVDFSAPLEDFYAFTDLLSEETGTAAAP